MPLRAPLPARQVFLQKGVGLPGVLMMGRYHYASSQSGLRPHSHQDAVEICFLERGEQTYRVDGRVYHLSGNDQFLTFPGEVHDTAGLPEQPGILYWLILKVKPSSSFLSLTPSLAPLLVRALCRMPHRHFQAHPDSARILSELITLLLERRSARSASDYRTLRVQSLLLQYLTLTLQAADHGRKGSASPLMERVLRFLETNLQETVSVSRLAEVARLSESRFKTRFKREIGVSPADFWLRKKIEKATSLLQTHNVTETAYALGFSSSQYFATVFKRYMLASPSKFLGPPTQRKTRD